MDQLLEIINTVKKNNNQAQMDNLADEMHLQDDIGFSSLELAELTVRIESEFGIDVYENEIVFTIGEIRSKLNQ